MIGNPILAKELWENFRRSRTFWLRAGFVAALIPPLILMRFGGVFEAIAWREHFMVLMWIELGMVTFLAPVFTAGAISSERSRRTLPALLMTELSPLQIVMGKLVPRATYLIMLVFSALPVLALWMIYGAITWSEVLQAQAVMVAVALLGEAVGIFWSSITLRALPALFASYATLALFYVWAPLLKSVGVIPVDSTIAMLLVTPLEVLRDIFSMQKALGGEGASRLSWGLGLLVCLVPIPLFLRAGALNLDPHRFERLRRRAGRLTRRWRNLVDARGVPDYLISVLRWGWATKPIAWRELFAARRFGLRRAVFVALALSILYVPVIALTWDFWKILAAHQVVVGMEIYLVCLIATATAASSIAQEKETRSLDILLTAPIRPHTIIWDKIFSLTFLFLVLLLPPFLHVVLFTTAGFLSPAAPLIFLAAIPAAVLFFVTQALFFSAGMSNLLSAQALSLVGLHTSLLVGLLPLFRVRAPWFLFLPGAPFGYALQGIRPGPSLPDITPLVQVRTIDGFALFLMSLPGCVLTVLVVSRIAGVLKDRFYRFVR